VNSLQLGGRDPHGGSDRAEAEAGQPGAQPVAQRPLGLGDGEHDEQPAGGAAAGEDAGVAGPQDRLAVLGQPVAGRAAAALGGDHPAALQARDARAHRLRVQTQLGHQRDQVRHRDPAAEPAQERAEERQQQRARHIAIL
jgi:hypothetical protein